jgi:hypothetical protein
MPWLSLLVSPDTPYHSKVMSVIVFGVSSLEIQNVHTGDPCLVRILLLL